MRLAYFTNTYPRATDTFIRREVLGLRKRGFEVLTYSVRRAGSDHDADEEVIGEKNNTRYILPFSAIALFFALLKLMVSSPGRFVSTVVLALRTARPGIKGHLLQAAYFLEAVSLAGHLRRDGIGHLHNHLGDNSGNVTLFAAGLMNIPFSISIHGPHIFFDGLYWALDRKTEYAKFIACIGHFCISQMMLYADIKYWHKFKIVRCGVDLEQFKFKPRSVKPRRLLYVGRISEEKGLTVLLESLALLKDRNYDWHLTLLGDGKDRAFLENRVRELDLQEQIEFKGFVDQKTIANTLKNSDIFVLPSFAEGIPVSLMEAMAVGIPVVATHVGGVSELVVDRQTGLVVHPSDVQGLADALASYIDDPELCKKIVKKAREKVVKDFDIEDQIDKLAVLFRE